MSESVRGSLPMVGAVHALPVIALSRAEQLAKHVPGTIEHWAQLKRWPREVTAALLAAPAAASVHTEADALAMAHDVYAGKNTVSWWGLRKKWPAWLVAAMAAQRHSNETLTEDEAHALAEATAGLPLGRK